MATYTPLQSITLTNNQAVVTFSNIDQTYTDLEIVVNCVDNNGDNNLSLTLNNDTGTNYSGTYLLGNGSSGVSSRVTNTAYAPVGRAGSSTTSPGISKIFISNYSNSGINKVIMSRGNNASTNVIAWSNLWRNTSAVTSITFTAGTTFAAGSNFSLYGIRGGGTSKASGGDIIFTDGTYWYHTFLRTGRFTPAIPNLSCDYVVVAGGGAGGVQTGGGGGAGGFRSSIGGTPLTLSTISYPIIVGAGGAPTPTNNTYSVPGSGSSFYTINATGGGGGMGRSDSSQNTSGGSGGGAANSSGGTTYGGSGNAGGYSPIEGYAGGNNAGDHGTSAAAGGGGAGGAGANGNSFSGNGTGGIGTYNTLTDAIGALANVGQLSSTHYYFAGGGGGAYGSGGTGGGGAGGNNSASTPGTANTGGGGGGQDGAGSAHNGSGGSGIVIVRYAV